MNKYHLIAILFFILGLVFFAFGIFSGEVETGFVLIFPFLVGSGVYALIGFIFVLFAILFFIFGFVKNQAYLEKNSFNDEDKDSFESREKKSVKGGGVVLIGPIPIVFGSNWKIAFILMLIAIILIISVVFAPRFL